VGRLLAIFAASFVGARAWRRHIAPGWPPELAALADLIGALAVVIALSELLGTFGQFRRGPIITGAVAFALTSIWWCAREAAPTALTGSDSAAPTRASDGTDADSPTKPAVLPTTDVVVASASTALVAAQWSTLVARGLTRGIGNGGGPGNGDSLWYHMPFAAAFVHSGWISRLQYLNGEALVTYYPANTSVLHAVGILAMGSDTLSLFVNLALVPVALLAGWCIGARVGVGPSSLAGVAVALTIPVVVVSESATAKDDLLGIVGLLACIAFVMHSARSSDGSISPSAHHTGIVDRATAVYAGLAAGLALGSKLTLVAPVLVLGVCLAVVTPSTARLSTMARWASAALATGGYWYVRNLLAVGNPLPGLSLGLGHVHLPHPPTPSMDVFGTNLLRNLGNARVWHQALLPGLRTGFGSAWPVITVVAAASMALGVVTLRGRELVAPVVGVMAFAAFVITPGTVWAPQLITKPGVRFITANLFAFNLRYMLPAVAIGLVILPLVARRWQHGPAIATAALGVALAATQHAPQSRQTWAPHEVPVALTIGVLTGAAMVRLTTGRSLLPAAAGSRRRLAVCAVAVVAIGVGWPAQRTYASHRYSALDLAGWADTRSGASIGYSGFVFSYPLWGVHLQNRVQMIGEHGPDGAWHPARTCVAWRRDVRRAHVQYVVIPVGAPQVGLGIDLSRWRVGLPGGEPPDEPPESRWTRTDPGARIVFRSTEGAAAYAISGPATARGCH